MGKKEFPSQVENRKQWILDTVRANQEEAALMLHALVQNDVSRAKWAIADLNTMDRDALLQPGGILTDEQIKLLTNDPSSTL